jgi:signal transduction histidine kinase
MFRWLIAIKIFLYAWVFIKAFQKTPISFPLVLIMLALLTSGFWRSFYQYTSSKVNISTLLLDLILAVLFALISGGGRFDKLFMLYLTEGTSVLPNSFFVAYAMLATAFSVGSTALLEFRDSGQMQLPEFAEIVLYVFVFVLVLSERKQREQRLAFEKLTKELSYVNLQLKESMALSESLASEAERRRIFGEIHDNLGHHLTGLILSLEAGKKLMSHDVEAGKTYWDRALQVSRVALHSIRELVSVKKESDFQFALTSRLQEMVREVHNLTGLKIDLNIKTQDIGLSGMEQFSIYRIFQEAITNTLRHADAEHAQISISGYKELLYFSYGDNGSVTTRIEAGNGLKGMKDRIAAMGGTIYFQSQSDLGFKIEGYIDRRGKE